MGNGLKFAAIETDLGWVGVAFSDGGLRAVNLPVAKRGDALRALAELGADEPASDADLGDVPASVRALVSGKPHANGVHLDWSGITPFRRAVLEECARIPAGQTVSYGELAAKVGRPGAARAVGRVMATNPWPLFVPCHRVVGSDGSLHGFGGGLPMKEALLRAEGAR
ncbi:MAG: methylated-DNA--[protein]-cysteine S-methyltransferase [Dehalococcoidia bacterium]